METKYPSIKTIILVDTIRPDNPPDDDLVQRHRAITLSSFRILSSLQATLDTQRQHQDGKVAHETGLKWTFKFFNSKSHKSAVKQDQFKDFKLKYFEQYEAKLQEKMSSEKVGRTSKITPAHALQKALAEIVTDIHWEMPDIASPIKIRRSSKQLIHGRKKKNIVFLFSYLPTNSQEMRKFAGKRVLDSEILLDAILPPQLFKQFTDCANLSLFWVDMTNMNKCCLTEPHVAVNKADVVSCVGIMEDFLRSVGGSVLSLQTIVNTTHHTQNSAATEQCSSDVQTVINENCRVEGEHTSSLISLFPSHNIINSSVHGAASDNPREASCTSAMLQLNTGDNTVCVRLKLAPIITSPNSKVKDGSHLSPASTHVDDKTRFLHDKLLQLPPTSDKSLRPDITVVSCPDRPLVTDDLELHIHSCVSKSSLSLRSFIGAENFHTTVDGQGETIPSESSRAFGSILKRLKKDDHILVLTVRCGSVPSPYLAVLDVLSRDTALMSVLPLGATLQLEKSRLAQHERSEQPPELPAPDSTLSKLDAAFRRESDAIKSKLCSKMSSKNKKRHTSGSAVCVSRCYNPQVLNPWHLPGSAAGFPDLVNKLNSRLQDMKFLSDQDKQTLKALQKMYRRENHPQATASANTASQTQGDMTVVSEAQEETCSTQAGSNLDRGMMMLNRSMAATRQRITPVAEAPQKDVPRDKKTINMSNLDLKTEESLCQYLHDVYDKTLEDQDGLETAVQNMVTVALHFFKDKGDNPQTQAMAVLRREVVKSTSALRELYQAKTSESDSTRKITEYKLQMLLLLEMESVVLSADDSHIENCADEVANLLRTLSFLAEPGFVPKYLSNVIVNSYSATLPRLLVGVYEELMQPLPESLAMFASPNKSADSSVFSLSVQSQDSLPDPYSQPDVLQSQSGRSLRTRKLVQHPSLSDIGNKKQIMVMKKPAEVKNKEKKTKHPKTTQPSSKPRKNKNKSDIVAVRRNLFEGDAPRLERRQSVAVMEKVVETPTKQRKSMAFRSPRAAKSPGNKRRSVAETPAHRQLSNAVWSRLDKKRKRTWTEEEEEVEVVQESPMKQGQDNFKKVSPSRNKHVVTMMRRSFYSAGRLNRSRNLTKYFQFADRIAGRQQRLSLGSVSTSGLHSDLKSPSRSSFLRSQLMCSPSPQQQTPRKPSATTPKHAVEESTFKYTRSRTPKKFPKVLNFESPRTSALNEKDDCSGKLQSTPKKPSSTPSKSMESASHHTRSSFINRGQAILASEVVPSTPTRTPRHARTPSFLSPPAPPLTPQRSILKSFSQNVLSLPSTPQSSSHVLVCESPSQNTRSRISTPSRASVCTALFAQSPRVRPSSRDRVVDGADLTSVPPSPRRVHFNKAIEKNHGIVLSHHVGDFQTVENSTNESSARTDESVTFTSLKESPSASSTETMSSGKIQRTPSPRKQPKVKTPDSFDKWPRRKRRWASPPQLPSGKEVCGQELSVMLGHKIDLCEGDSADIRVSRKRSFLESSIDCEYSSPSKRARKSLCDSVSSRTSQNSRETRFCLHQRVSSLAKLCEDPVSSLNSSQASSAVDYFSSTNDEVFLISDMDSIDFDSTEATSEISWSVARTSRSKAGCLPRPESPVFRSCSSVNRFHQGDTTAPSTCSSQGFYVNSEVDDVSVSSPRFLTSPAATRKHRTSSPGNTKHRPSSDLVSPDPKSAAIASPRTRSADTKSPDSRKTSRSPQDNKFSPSVSARSLVHLMNSPLINTDQLQLPPMSRYRVHSKSRKSLNMQK